MVRIVPSFKLVEKYSSIIRKSSSFMNNHRGVFRDSPNNLVLNLRLRAMVCFRSKLHVPEISDNGSKVTDDLAKGEHLLASSELHLTKGSRSQISTAVIYMIAMGIQSDCLMESPELPNVETVSVESFSEKHSGFLGAHVEPTNFQDLAVKMSMVKSSLPSQLQANDVQAAATFINNEKGNTGRDGNDSSTSTKRPLCNKEVMDYHKSSRHWAVCSNRPITCESKSALMTVEESLDASKLALETYLCKVKNLSIQDASYIAENAPIYVAKLKVFAEDWQKLSARFLHDTSLKTTLELFLEENGLKELEPFFESIGVGPEYAKLITALQLELTREKGILPTFKFLETMEVERRELGKFVERNQNILCYSVRTGNCGLVNAFGASEV